MNRIVGNKVNALYDELLSIFKIAGDSSTHHAAVALGDSRLENKVGKREEAPCFHHRSV